MKLRPKLVKKLSQSPSTKPDSHPGYLAPESMLLMATLSSNSPKEDSHCSPSCYGCHIHFTTSEGLLLGNLTLGADFYSISSFRLKETKAFPPLTSGNEGSLLLRFIDKKHKNHLRLYSQALCNWTLVVCHLGYSNCANAWKTTPFIMPLPHRKVVIHCFLPKSLLHPSDTGHLYPWPCFSLLLLLMASLFILLIALSLDFIFSPDAITSWLLLSLFFLSTTVSRIVKCLKKGYV